MARPRQFDPEEVLDAARDLFWARGYQATSLDDITAATGVNKPSLFSAFGDKAGLFGAVLERYHTMLLQYAKAMLEKPGSAKEAVRAWLTGYLPACSGARGKRGCLSANAGVMPADAAIAKSVGAYNKQLELLIRQALERGREAGEFRRDFDTRGAARALIATQMGLMLMARFEPSANETRAAMDRALTILDD